MSLKDYIQQPLTESVTKNLHLDHIEDIILDGGLASAHIALNFLENIVNSLQGNPSENISVTTKWDGSPAIVCGINPQNGRFFIGTKSVFNKRSPKIIYTKDDIRKYHKGNPGLQKQLEQVLQYLPKLDITDVVQGDLMFSQNEVKEKTIDGKKYVTFKPNTIMYAIPFNSDLAEKIRRAKIGIIFHTKYKGDSLKNMTASFDVNIEEFNQTEDVWFDDATYQDESGTVSFTEDEVSTILGHLQSAEDALKNINPIQLEQLLTSKTLIGMLKMYTNAEIRDGNYINDQFLTKFSKFVQQKIDNEKIREQTKEKKKMQYETLLNRLKSVLADILEFQYYVNEAKLAIINKLHEIESVDTFISTENGKYKATKQEGFVATDHLTNKAVKLVDRLEFSKMNMLRFQ